MNKKQFLEITHWQEQTFKTATAISKAHHLKQEVDELISDLEHKSKVSHLEYADCFLLLFGSASANGMSYEDICACIDEKFGIVKKRNWGEPDKNGVVNHIVSFEVGQQVHYTNSGSGEKENGIVKEVVSPTKYRVVYNKDYTSALTDIRDLKGGWVEV